MIEIRNLYYLFLYAWDKFVEGEQIEVGYDDSPDLPNLLAKVLTVGMHRQVRRGLNRAYVETVDELAHPRGKFLLAETVKRNSLVSGRAVCEFDELSIDTTPNRILKASLRRLYRSPDIAPSLTGELRRLEARLEGVRSLLLSPSLFRSLQLTRNHGHYALLMRVCHLVMELSMPDEEGSGHRFYNLLDDETRMSSVFEHFVRNFFRMEQNRYSVGSEVLQWPAHCRNTQDAEYLPIMLTDVTLRSADRTVVIDAKYYKETFISRLGGARKIHSSHLYQLQSYLKHTRTPPGQGGPEGVLLYPSVDGNEVRLEFQFPRHRIRVWTLDLTQPWQHVHRQLLELAGLAAA